MDLAFLLKKKKKKKRTNVQVAKFQTTNVSWTSRKSEKVTLFFLVVYIENWNTGKKKKIEQIKEVYLCMLAKIYYCIC